MINWSLLSVFVPTFFVVSITPGMCMTLAMSLGMSIGIKRTLWMMAGELIGVAIVATSAAAGIAALMLQFPVVFFAFKILGGVYLIYLGYELWMSKGRLALSDEGLAADVSSLGLAWQGFMTAIANPKGWAFFIALLPPFISPNIPMAAQLPLLIMLILLLEFLCLLIYAAGGKTVSLILQSQQNVKLINRMAGSLMALVGVWLMLT